MLGRVVHVRTAGWRARALSSIAAVTTAVLAVSTVHGASLAGNWSGGGVTETINVTSWNDDCGPRPKAGGGGGGSYGISPLGDELAFAGPHPFRTDTCWAQEGTTRVSHTATPSLRWWKTRCESPAGDPRKATITTVVRATGDESIVLSETAHYSFVVAAGECTADVERSASFKLVARSGETPATASVGGASVGGAGTVAPPPARATPTAPVCETLGDPATLEARPKRKILRPGEQFDFRARVLDARGCELGSKVTFRLAPESAPLASAILVDANGRVKVRADAEPVTLALVVEGASKAARVELEVVSDQRYAELLGTGGLDDAGIDDHAVSVVVSGGVGNTAATSADVQADEWARRRFAWLAIVGGTCALLALFGVVLWRRGAPPPPSKRTRRTIGTRARRLEVEGGRDRGAVARRSPLHIPAPPRDVPANVDAASQASAVGVSTVVGSAPAPGPVVQTHGRACPTCGEVFPTDAGFCPHDGTTLIPTAAEVSPPRPSAAVEGSGPGRICPVCGKRYAPSALYCGRDGIELVPLN